MSKIFSGVAHGTAVSIPLNMIVDDNSKEGFVIDTKFDHQKFLIQFAEVVAISKNEKIIEVGDTLIFHFNVTAYTFKGGVRTPSNLMIHYDSEGAIYKVPSGMSHAVIKSDGRVIMLNGYCFLKPHKQEANLIDSFIISIERKVSGASPSTSAEILNISQDDNFKIGDIAALPIYSNYEIKMPDGSTFWCVRSKYLIGKYE